MPMLAGIPVSDADLVELVRLLREVELPNTAEKLEHGGVLLREHEWRVREGLA